MKGVYVASLFVVGVLFAQNAAAIDENVPIQFIRAFLRNALGEDLMPRITIECLHLLDERDLLRLGPAEEVEELPSKRGLTDVLRGLLNSRTKRGVSELPDPLPMPEISDEVVLEFCGNFVPPPPFRGPRGPGGPGGPGGM